MDKNKTVTTFVLDESGSMEDVREQTIIGINSYIDKLKTDSDEITVNFLTFNSRSIKTLYDFQPISEIKAISGENYRPAAMTPLYDAIGSGIEITDDYISEFKSNSNIIFAIMTDGFENCSKEYTHDMILRLIQSRTEQNWVFTYLGANQDSWDVGRRLGLSQDHVADYNNEHPEYAFSRYAEKIISKKEAMKRGRYSDAFFTEKDKRDIFRGS
tara:strand:+ start:737 stop:1378 length:642 start_codon:yes stop_codon:yes gene_type:complete